LIKPGFRAPFASRLPVVGCKTGWLREKAGSTVEAASIAAAYILAVVAMMVIAGMVIYVR
jgi:hypothetical protein